MAGRQGNAEEQPESLTVQRRTGQSIGNIRDGCPSSLQFFVGLFAKLIVSKAVAVQSILSYLGIWLSGDIGPITMYTNKNGKKVWYAKSPPDKPASDEQAVQRTKFTCAMTNWRSLTIGQKRNWEWISLKASLPMTGHNLFVSQTLLPDPGALQTLIRETGIIVSQPVCVL